MPYLRQIPLWYRDRCPDDGKCHHICGEQEACFRVLCCEPLSNVFPNDEWPPEMVVSHRKVLGSATMPKSKTPTMVEVDQEEFAGLLMEGVHVGLRKGSEAPSSGPLWRAISESNDGAWGDAMRYAVWGLEHMGFKLMKPAE